MAIGGKATGQSHVTRKGNWWDPLVDMACWSPLMYHTRLVAFIVGSDVVRYPFHRGRDASELANVLTRSRDQGKTRQTTDRPGALLRPSIMERLTERTSQIGSFRRKRTNTSYTHKQGHTHTQRTNRAHKATQHPLQRQTTLQQTTDEDHPNSTPLPHVLAAIAPAPALSGHYSHPGKDNSFTTQQPSTSSSIVQG